MSPCPSYLPRVSGTPVHSPMGKGAGGGGGPGQNRWANRQANRRGWVEGVFSGVSSHAGSHIVNQSETQGPRGQKEPKPDPPPKGQAPGTREKPKEPLRDHLDSCPLVYQGSLSNLSAWGSDEGPGTARLEGQENGQPGWERESQSLPSTPLTTPCSPRGSLCPLCLDYPDWQVWTERPQSHCSGLPRDVAP